MRSVSNLTFCVWLYFILCFGLPRGSDSKESTCDAGDPGLIPESGRFPGEGNDNPLQYSCLENSMDREAWWSTIHGITKSWTHPPDSSMLSQMLEFPSLDRWIILHCTYISYFLHSLSSLSFIPHIQSLNRSYWLYLQNISRIWLLPPPPTPSLITSVQDAIISFLDHF